MAVSQLNPDDKDIIQLRIIGAFPQVETMFKGSLLLGHGPVVA
jgi:hypothetical protein